MTSQSFFLWVHTVFRVGLFQIPKHLMTMKFSIADGVIWAILRSFFYFLELILIPLAENFYLLLVNRTDRWQWIP